MDFSNLNTVIGILGGTFNPVHMGHLILAQNAIDMFNLSKVLFIPCAIPPHKNMPVSMENHRTVMLKLAIEDNLCFEVCDIEIKRGGVSYSIDTVNQLKEIYPGAKLYFIIGSDTLPELYLWKDIYKLLNLCEFITFARPGFNIESITLEDLHLKGLLPDKLLKNIVNGRLIDISSSDIRYRIAEGMSINYIVPSSIEMYIAEHNLYRTG